MASVKCLYIHFPFSPCHIFFVLREQDKHPHMTSYFKQYADETRRISWIRPLAHQLHHPVIIPSTVTTGNQPLSSPDSHVNTADGQPLAGWLARAEVTARPAIPLLYHAVMISPMQFTSSSLAQSALSSPQRMQNITAFPKLLSLSSSVLLCACCGSAHKRNSRQCGST